MPMPPAAVSPPIDRVLARLTRVRVAGHEQWTALCPAHDDREASLSLGLGEDGRVLMRCHAGCETAAIVAAIGLSFGDLFAAERSSQANGLRLPAVERAQGVEGRSRLVKTYDYADANGALVFQVCRFEPKTFRQRRQLPSGEWKWGLGDVAPVLYRLPALIEAVAHERRIFVVEGEKDADALADLGYAATTSPMGAGKWRDAYSDDLAGADVVLLPDNDDAGRKHAEQVALSLFAAGARVRVVALPNLPPKGDVSDWLAGGGDLDALESLIGRTPTWSPGGDEQPSGVRRTRWRLDELLDDDEIMRPPPPVVPRLAWSGRSTLLAAREKSGKSTLIGYIASQVTRGGTFLGEPCERGEVLIIGLEEFIGDAARRLRHFEAIGSRVHLVDRLIGHADPNGPSRPQEILAHIDAVKPALVIIDSLSAYSHGQVQDDNNATQMASVVQPLTDLAHRLSVALIIVHHARKSDGRARGSTAITAGTDVVVEFFCPDENADLTVRRMRTAGRVPVAPVYDVRFDGHTYQPASAGAAPLGARILAVVRDRPAISVTDLTEAVSSRKEDVHNAVQDLLAKGTLANVSDNSRRMKLVVPATANLSFIGDSQW